MHGARPVPGKPPNNLPQPLTSFIGREQEIAEVRRLLGGTRLLTLIGAGGVGKTRLGHEVAASLLAPSLQAAPAMGAAAGPAFLDGVWIVELAGMIDPTQVPQAVADVLEMREEAERPLIATLTEALRSRQTLLMLDSCEHLIEACAELVDALLRACSGLRIIATSRQPLGIVGETTFWVPSLSLSAHPPVAAIAGVDDPHDPGTGSPPSARSMAFASISEAARLFVERARAVEPAFTPTERSARAVEQICQRLDGIPLAIELAAARVRALSVEQIAARLDDRFRLLTGGSRTALPRYRTLRALIDWSHDLLDEQEQILLRRLAVFSCSWTLDAAEAVCAGEGLASTEILDLLSGLVVRSLVLTDQHAEEVRYRFLESLREYAAEKLRDAAEETVLRARHRDWFLARAERAEPELHGTDSVRWLDRLERDRENFRAALGWCIERREAESGLRLAGSLARFWLVRGNYRESRRMLEELLALSVGQECSESILSARTMALYSAGALAIRQDDCAAANAYCSEALAASRQLGDRRRLAIAQFSSGHLSRYRGEYPLAHRQLEEARQMFEELGDRHWQARAHHELGIAAYFEGDVVSAREHYEASLGRYRDLGDELGIVCELNELGEVALLCGDLGQARSLLAECLTIARRVNDKERIAMALAALAGLATQEGRPTRAVRLVAAALALNDVTGQRNSPAWHALIERWLEPARTVLGPEACAAAEAAGRAMSLDEAIEYALASEVPAEDRQSGARSSSVAACREHLFDTSTADARPPMTLLRDHRMADQSAGQVVSRRSRDTIALTQREAEVAALVAHGLTNRQIADELAISTGTATNHVKRILARLGLDTRVQIAAWAIERGLHRSPLA